MKNGPDPAEPNTGGGRTKWRDLEMRDSNRRMLMVILLIIIAIGIIAAAALVTLQITPDQPSGDNTAYPYTTTYRASLPDSEPIQVGSLYMLAMQTGDRMALKIGGHREELQLGETRQIGSRTFTIKVFGVPVYETGYQLTATWTGVEGDRALFKIVLRTSRQVPEWMMNRILPGSIEAVPA